MNKVLLICFILATLALVQAKTCLECLEVLKNFEVDDPEFVCTKLELCTDLSDRCNICPFENGVQYYCTGSACGGIVNNNCYCNNGSPCATSC
jgi:hypothetical protein